MIAGRSEEGFRSQDSSFRVMQFTSFLTFALGFARDRTCLSATTQSHIRSGQSPGLKVGISYRFNTLFTDFVCPFEWAFGVVHAEL